MNLRFLPAEQPDIESLFDLNKSLIGQYEDLSSIQLDKVLPWVRRKLEVKLPEYRAVFLNEQKVGYFRLFNVDDAALELDDLFILAPYRGRGIGSEILRHCIRESEKQQKPLMLYVFTENRGAIRLYEQFGFRVREIVSPTRSIMERPAETAI